MIGSEKCHRRALPFSRPSFWSVCEADESPARASNAEHGIHQQGGVNYGDRSGLFLRRSSQETDRGLIQNGWQVNPRHSAYGNKSFPYNDLGAIIDYNAQVLLVQKVLGELARDPSSGSFKDAQKQRDDHNILQPGGSNSCWGGGSGVGANP